MFRDEVPRDIQGWSRLMNNGRNRQTVRENHPIRNSPFKIRDLSLSVPLLGICLTQEGLEGNFLDRREHLSIYGLLQELLEDRTSGRFQRRAVQLNKVG